MALILTSSASAISPGRSAFFLGTGGTEPYVYSLAPGGVGGAVDPSTGEYDAPIGLTGTDVVIVTDATTATASLPILVGSAMELVCDIISKEMELDSEQVILWDQKFDIPNDSRIYIAVSFMSGKPFGNNYVPDGSGAGIDGIQSINMLAVIGIDIMSRSYEAVTRKEEVLMALKSQYAESQQEANTFFIATLPVGFVNISGIDGAAIPYRFHIDLQMQYYVTKTKAVPYIDDFSPVEITTEP